MKKQFLTLLAALLLTVTGGAALAEQHAGHAMGNNAPAGESAHADVKKHMSCAHCGMDRDKYAHSRMLVTYDDGTTAGTCSIHCTAIELKASKGKKVQSVEVGDYNSKKLIDAKKAFWVVGGDKKGVMSKTPKWAFAKKSAAEEFIKKSGGKLATFNESLALAEKE